VSINSFVNFSRNHSLSPPIHRFEYAHHPYVWSNSKTHRIFMLPTPGTHDRHRKASTLIHRCSVHMSAATLLPLGNRMAFDSPTDVFSCYNLTIFFFHSDDYLYGHNGRTNMQCIRAVMNHCENLEGMLMT